MEEIVATAHGVTKRFAGNLPPALDSVDIDISRGRMTGLVGPDGAGKTTLIRILAGLVVADAGEISINGQPASLVDRATIGYMPQRFGLYEDLSVRENLELYADLRALPLEKRTERFETLLDFTDLRHFQQRLAGQLSGGMKQKLGLACALIRKPDLLLLDEPSVGVDPISRRELWSLVQSLANEGIGVLWSTAYLDEAEKCDTVFLLNEGQLLFHGRPSEQTDRMQGRVVRIALPEARRRSALRQALEQPGIADGAVQGDSIRLLLRDGADRADVDKWADDLGSGLQPVKSRFEDGFIDLLGGGPTGVSSLASNYRTIPEDDRPAIEADGLTKKFGDFTAAHDIRFSVGRGQVFGLLGPNGAGKSTTFKMLCGLLTPTEGTGSVAGNDLRHARADARQSLGYMAQKFSLYGDLSVRQNLIFFAGAYGLSGEAAETAIGKAIDTFHLERYLKDNSGGLPLGFKQRLALACAVLHQPPVLFLDEPTSGVDPIVRREFWMHINGLVEKGVAVLVTTHFMEEAEYCDRIALIYQANQIATGTPDELKVRAGRADGTMEEAFIALIEANSNGREAA